MDYLTQSVFCNDLVFEKILSLLIFDDDLNIDRKMVQSLRLVQKHWLYSTSKLLKKKKRPVMVLRETNTRNGVVYTMAEIVENLTSLDRLLDSFLPIKLLLTRRFFRNENEQSLLACLTGLAPEIVELDVNIPSNGSTVPLNLPTLKLEKLRKISFEFTEERGAGYDRDDWITEEANFVLQEILNGAENLHNFVSPRITQEKMLLLQETLNGIENIQNIVFPEVTEERMLQLQETFIETENLRRVVYRGITTEKMLLLRDLYNGVQTIQNIFYSRIIEERMLQLQEILNGAQNLETVVFQRSSIFRFANHFENLQFPNSITSVEIEDRFKKEYEQVLLRNSLPKFTHLTLVLSSAPSETNGLFRVLENFKHSLISLHVSRFSHDNPVVKFPEFEKLESMHIKGVNLESGSASVHKLFPSLKSIDLYHQTEATLSDWTRDSKFEMVESLNLNVLEESEQNNHDKFKTVSMEMLAQVHTAFPNISSLAITLNCKDVKGLISMYQMVQLKSLVIYIPEGCTEHLKWNYEASLTGLPAWLISGYAEDSEYFQKFIRRRGKKPCINNLSELTNFTLLVQTDPYTSARVSAQQRPAGCTLMFSNMLFTQAFFHMPELRSITLSENIQPTEMVEEKWKAQGGHIKYISARNILKNH